MSDLNADGKALVQAARQADRPSDADRERVRAALRQRLGDAALLAPGLAEPAVVSSSGASYSKWIKWGWLGPTVIAAGALWFAPRLWHGRAPAAATPNPSAVSAQLARPESTEIAPEVAANPSVALAEVATNRPADAQKATPRARDGLSEEVLLLSRAETELHAGRPGKALLALAEHQRKFPRGALAEERTAARIQALCALGRNDEANTQLKQLLHLSPNSAHEGRARQACRDPRATP